MKITITIFYTIIVTFIFVNVERMFFAYLYSIIFAFLTYFLCRNSLSFNKKNLTLLASQIMFLILTEGIHGADALSLVCFFYCLFFLLNYFVGKSAEQVFAFNLFTQLIISLKSRSDIKYISVWDGEGIGFANVELVFLLLCGMIISVILICLKEKKLNCAKKQK